jgi:hypothetical protein
MNAIVLMRNNMKRVLLLWFAISKVPKKKCVGHRRLLSNWISDL